MRALDAEEGIRPSSEFRADAAGLWAQARPTKSALVLTHRGQTSAVVPDPAEYRWLFDELDLLRDIHPERADRKMEAAELAAEIQENFEELGA